tara:strand:+ start:2931 stop:4178 length:1248 start_codon:yes stop_codon:yes gene_type:complete
LKVLFFLNSFPNSSETFIVSQIVGLINRGVDVEIFALSKGDLNNVHGDVDKYNLLERCSFANEGIGKFDSILARGLSVAGNLFNFDMIRCFNVGIGGRDSVSLNLHMATLKLRRLEYDNIIAHFGSAGAFAAKLHKLGILKGKLIPVFHGSDISKKSNLKRYEKEYQRLFDVSWKVISISDKWKHKLIELGCAESKILVNRMGIDLEKFRRKTELKAIADPMKIITICRFVEKKGIEYAIQAMKILTSNKFNFEYTLIGNGPLIDSLKIQVTNLDLQDKVKFLGFRPQEEIRELLEDSDVFLLPSITAEDGDMEGIPVALMESMALSVLTLSTYHSGIPELIDNEVNGYLVQEKDPEKIAETLVKIISSKSDLSNIKLNARKKIDDMYNQQKIYDQLFNILLGCKEEQGAENNEY